MVAIIECVGHARCDTSSRPPRTATARFTEEEKEAGGCDLSPRPLLERNQSRPASLALSSQALPLPAPSARLALTVLVGSTYVPVTCVLEMRGFFPPTPLSVCVVSPNMISYYGTQDFTLAPANFTF